MVQKCDFVFSFSLSPPSYWTFDLRSSFPIRCVSLSPLRRSTISLLIWSVLINAEAELMSLHISFVSHSASLA